MNFRMKNGWKWMVVRAHVLFCLEILGGRKTDHAKSGIDELHKYGLKVLKGFHHQSLHLLLKPRQGPHLL
jgi:hypothetical protein